MLGLFINPYFSNMAGPYQGTSASLHPENLNKRLGAKESRQKYTASVPAPHDRLVFARFMHL